MTAGLVTGWDVTLAVQVTLQQYLPVVLAHPDVNHGAALRAPVAYTYPSAGAARLNAAQTPMLWVSPTGTGGLADVGGGSRAITWEMDVGYIIRSDTGTYEDTLRDATLYAAAIRTVLVERPTLGGVARALWGIDEEYDAADVTAGRTLAEGHVTFSVQADDAARRQLRFTVPGLAPVDSIATTKDVTVHLLKET